jgi:hypothetical protein
MEGCKEITHDYCCMYTSSSKDEEARIFSMPWLRHFIIRSELTPMILHVEGQVVGGDRGGNFSQVVYFIFNMPTFALQIILTHQVLIK